MSKPAARDYLETIKYPRFGRGSGMNPCLDCRIHLFSKALTYMREQGADFIASGEVLGERPMSQRRQAMQLIEKESGLCGLLVRPLSAQHFAPTLAEESGLLDRERLLAFQGRGRRPQIELADHYGINDYPCPAGGCKLTEKGFAAKFAELLKFEGDFGLREARLLSYGKHFRLPGGEKAILGRDERENEILVALAREGDTLVAPTFAHGPTALLLAPRSTLAASQTAALIAQHSKAADGHFTLTRLPFAPTSVSAAPVSEVTLHAWRIAEAQPGPESSRPTCIC